MHFAGSVVLTLEQRDYLVRALEDYYCFLRLPVTPAERQLHTDVINAVLTPLIAVAQKEQATMKTGDIVKLSTGGPEMTVDRVVFEDERYGIKAGSVCVRWFNGAHLHCAVFQACQLVRISDFDPRTAETLNGYTIAKAAAEADRLARAVYTDAQITAAAASRDLESRADFLVVDGKVVKDRGGNGVWPPKASPSERVIAVGVKDLRTGETVYGTSPAGWYGKGIVENHRQTIPRGDEYYVRFVGSGGADWYSSGNLDSSPKHNQEGA